LNNVTTREDSTFNTTVLRVIPGKQNFDGLAYYVVAPRKKKKVVVDASFAILYANASVPNWFSTYQCMKTGDHPWLSRNNSTQLNVPGPP
jgi:hypothetical protein